MSAFPTPRHFVKQVHGYTGQKVTHERTGDHNEIPHRNADANERYGLRAMAVLQRHYPGYPWFVACNVFQGVILIELKSFSDWQEIVRLADVANHHDFERLVKNAGGNWLKRFGLPLRGFDIDRYLDARQTYRPDFTRQLKPPD